MNAPVAFYNEHDPKAAAWLRELIAQGHIAPGVVDERSISDIAPDELTGFIQCHFFAGIGVWPLALRAAGWADDRPIWTGSCPCQPFSAAGKGDGFDDERHLWPDWHWLIEQRRPPVLLGEQVASKDALVWIDLVSADLEAAGYAFGAADLCAAGAGLEAFEESVWGERLSRAVHLCPDPVVAGALGAFADFAARNLGGEHGGAHIRQRAYLVGLADVALGGFGERGDALGPRDSGHANGGGDAPDRLVDGEQSRLERHRRHGDDGHQPGRVGSQPDGSVAAAGHSDRIPDALRDGARNDTGAGLGAQAAPDGSDGGLPGERLRAGLENSSDRISHAADDHRRGGERGTEAGAGPDGIGRRGLASGRSGSNADAPNRRRGDADWLLSRDARWRPVEPGTFPLAHAAPARVGRLRGYGNALDFETALAWVETVKAHLDGEPVERIAA